MFLKETKKKLSHKTIIITKRINLLCLSGRKYIYIYIEGERNSNGNIVWRDSRGWGEVFLIEFLELSIINKQKSQ